MRRLALALVLVALTSATSRASDETIFIGSKNFTEGVVLGELARALVQEAGAAVEHQQALGGTRLVFNALVSGEIDVYAEYTGTLTHEILAARSPANESELRAILAESGLVMSRPLGFRDNYALGMPREKAERLGISRISDLRDHPDLVLRFGTEFVDRADGWSGLRQRYGLTHSDVRGIEHDLAYRGVAAGDVDVTDLYTTDAEIAYYDLFTLEDDLGYFPRYDAVLLYRADLETRAPRVIASLRRLEGTIDEEAMIAMNARVKLDGEAEARVAADFLSRRLGLDVEVRLDGRLQRLGRYTVDHIALVSVSLIFAVLCAIPLGIVAAHRPRAGQIVLGIVGIAQTIPALALLVFMIPLLGIGAGPAVVALFLYSLLPIVRNTHAGITGIPRSLRESAEALGLPPGAVLRRVELPLATPSIVAGIKTAAVINIGAATLGALIGAGGYGQPILAGIRLDDTGLILEGAVPAALLALAVQAVFDLAERAVVPRGLRAATGTASGG
jgi:osmoprotectant transport system permease protein